MRRLARIVVLVCVVACGPRSVDAGVITLEALPGYGTFLLEGEFANDNDVRLIPFSVVTGTLFSARTTSWAAGGFDPYMALFDHTGSLVHYPDPTDPAASLPALSVDIEPDPDPALRNWDDILTFSLTEGSYTLALLQYGNVFQNNQLFAFDPDPRYTFTNFGQPQGCEQFISAFGDECGTGSFALQVDLIAPTPPPDPVPEPATLILVGIGTAGAALRTTVRRRRTPSSH